MPTLEEQFNARAAGGSLESEFNTRKKTPPRSLWKRFMDNYILAGIHNPFGLEGMQRKQLQERGWSDEKINATEKALIKRQERKQEEDPAWGGNWYPSSQQDIVEGLTDFAGAIVGGADPSYFIGGPGKTWIPRVLGQAGINAGLDAASQGIELKRKVRDTYSAGQTLLNAAAGAALQGGAELIGRNMRGTADEAVSGGDARPEQSGVEDSIDRRIKGLDAVADHPNTNPNEAKAARARADYLRAKHGRPPREQSEPEMEVPTGEFKPLGIEDAASVAKRFGTVTSTLRSAARNKKVGGAKNSYHLSGRAMDIARKAGVSHAQIEAALRKAGYNIVESIDEGDHSHFAFNFARSTPDATEFTIDDGDEFLSSEGVGRTPQPTDPRTADMHERLRSAIFDEVPEIDPREQVPFVTDDPDAAQRRVPPEPTDFSQLDETYQRQVQEDIRRQALYMSESEIATAQSPAERSFLDSAWEWRSLWDDERRWARGNSRAAREYNEEFDTAEQNMYRNYEIWQREVAPENFEGPYQNTDLPQELTDVISGEDLQRLIDNPRTREITRDLLSEYSSLDLTPWRRNEIHQALRQLNNEEPDDPYYDANWDEPDIPDIDDDLDIRFDDEPDEFDAGDFDLATSNNYGTDSSPINSIVNPLHPLAARQREFLQELYLRNSNYAHMARRYVEGTATRRGHDEEARDAARRLNMVNEYDELFPNREAEPPAYREYEERTGNTIGPLTRMAVENVASNHDIPLERAARMYVRGLGREGSVHPFVREVSNARDALAEMSMSPSEFESYKALPDTKPETKVLKNLPENVHEFPQSRIVGSKEKPRLIIERIEPYYSDDGSLVVVGKVDLGPKAVNQAEWARPSFRMTTNPTTGKANIDIYGSSKNQLGPTELMALSEQIAKRFPDIKEIGGYRVTGIREKVGKPGYNRVPIGKLRERGQKVPESLPENVLRINQKELDAEIAAKEQAMVEAEQRQTRQLKSLSDTLDDIYDSIRNGEAYMTPGDIREMREDSFIDSMIRQLDGLSFPKGGTATLNENLIRDIARKFDRLDTTMEGMAQGKIPVRQKPTLSVIEGGKTGNNTPEHLEERRNFFLTSVKNTVSEILGNEEGVFRPDELWRTLSSWRDRKAAYEASVGGPDVEADPVLGPLDRLFKAVRKAKKATPEQERAYHEERSRRVGRAAGRAQHTSGIAGLKAEQAELAGELPKIDLEPIRDQFTEQEIDMIMEDIKASSGNGPSNNKRRVLSYLEGMTVRNAVDYLLDGKLPTPSELGLIYRVYPQLVDSVLSKRSKEEKFKEFLREVWETSRGSMGSGDVSFTGRQGFMMLSRPEWWKAAVKQFAALPATKGKEVLDEQLERITQHPLYDHLKKMGIEIMDTGGHGNRDEFAVKSLAEHKFNPFSPVVKGSNRAYTYMANELRPQLALNILEKHKAKGVNIDDPAYLKLLGEYLNTFTGRGKFVNPKIDALMPAANLVMFAPRFVLSTFKRFSPILWGKMLRHPAILKEAARDSGAYLMTLFGVLALADQAGYEVDWDVRSPTGLKIKHGNTTYDVGAGLIQTAGLLEKLRTEVKFTGKGEKVDLTSGDYGQDDLGDITGRFFRTKLHPSLAYLWDMKTGTNVVGEPFDPVKDTYELFLPMYSTSMAEHLHDVGPEGAAAGLPAILGVGMQTYKPPKSDPKESLESKFKKLGNSESLESQFNKRKKESR